MNASRNWLGALVLALAPGVPLVVVIGYFALTLPTLAQPPGPKPAKKKPAPKAAKPAEPAEAAAAPVSAPATEAAAGGDYNYWDAAIGCAVAAAGGGFDFDFRRGELSRPNAMRGIVVHAVQGRGARAADDAAFVCRAG